MEMTGAQMHFRALLDRLLFNFMAENKPKDNIDIFSPFFFFTVSRKKLPEVKQIKSEFKSGSTFGEIKMSI